MRRAKAALSASHAASSASGAGVFYTIRAKYELAVVSVEEKLQGRYREVVDEYYNYMNEYPEGKYVKQVQKFYDYASKRITDTY